MTRCEPSFSCEGREETVILIIFIHGGSEVGGRSGARGAGESETGEMLE